MAEAQKMKLENLRAPRGSRIKHLPGVEICLTSCDLDLLTHKVDRFMPLLCGPLLLTGIKVGSVVLKSSCSQVR